MSDFEKKDDDILHEMAEESDVSQELSPPLSQDNQQWPKRYEIDLRQQTDMFLVLSGKVYIEKVDQANIRQAFFGASARRESLADPGKRKVSVATEESDLVASDDDSEESSGSGEDSEDMERMQ